MSWWDNVWGRTPPPVLLADVKALPPTAQEAALVLSERHAEQLEVLDAAERTPGDRPPKDTGDRITQPGSAMWRSYPADSITPMRYQWIKREADQGQTSLLMELLDDVAIDYQVGSQLRTRKLAVAGAPALFEAPPNSGDLGKRISDEAQASWEKIPRQFVVDILDDLYRGFSCVRPIVDSINGRWDMVAHRRVDSRYFRFDNAETPLITPTPGGWGGVPVPDGYIYSERSDNPGSVVRQGVGRPLCPLYIRTGYFWVWLSSFLERFGSPHLNVTTAKALRDGSQELEQIKAAARAFVQDHIGIMPEGTTLAVMDAVNKGATVRDVYLAAINFADLCKSKIINGQVSSSDFGPGGLGHGGESEQQGETKQDIVEADGGHAEDIITRCLWTPWTRWNFGPQAPVPLFSLLVTKPEDQVKKTTAQKNRAETLNILRNFIPLSATQVYDEFELNRPEEGDPKDVIPIAAPPPETTQTGDPAGTVAPGGKAKGAQAAP